MMYPWLDYKGLAYYSKKLRDKLKTAFNDVYEKITGTSNSIETLNSALDTTNQNVTQNASDISSLNSALADLLIAQRTANISLEGIEAGAFQEYTVDLSLSGYTPIAIADFYWNYSNGNVYRARISNNTLTFAFRNFATSGSLGSTYYANFAILYKKSL